MMDPAVLSAPPDTIPPDVDAALWLRYVKGAKSFDQIYALGVRCPSNDRGVKCLCLIPTKQYCKYFQAVKKLAEQIGGEVLTMMGRFD